MTKLEELIKEYQDKYNVLDSHISNTIKQIKKLGLRPVWNKDKIKILNTNLKASQSAKNLHQIFINDLKRLTNSYSDWLWKFKEGLIKTGHAKGIINRCDCGTISDSWCNDTPCYEAVYDDAQMDKDIEGLINEALKD